MKKILILNDDEDTMSLMKIFLKLHSYEAEYMYRARGEEVLEKVVEFSPDLVILESIVGPEGELCKRIKNRAGANIPVLLMTGSTLPGKGREVCAAEDSIAKPFEPATLLKKINKLIRHD